METKIGRQNDENYFGMVKNGELFIFKDRFFIKITTNTGDKYGVFLGVVNKNTFDEIYKLNCGDLVDFCDTDKITKIITNAKIVW